MRLKIIVLFLAVAFALTSDPRGLFLGKSLTEQGFTTGDDVLDLLVDNWYALSVAGITISFLIAVLMYMGSKALNSEYLQFYFKMEMESVLNAIAVLMVLSSVIFLLDNLFADPNTPAVNKIVNNVLNALEFNENKLLSTYATTLREISEINLKSSRTIEAGIDEVLVGSPTYSTTLNPESKASLIVKNKVLQHISNLYVYGTGIKTVFQKFLIPVSVLLVGVGMFLYSFYFTRRFGATMLALGISGYVVLPLLLHFLMTLAGFIQPSSPFLPGPECPSLCSMPVPTVVDSSGNSVNLQQEFEEIISANPDVSPFENPDFVTLLNLSEGKLSKATLGSGNYKGQELYSCENTTSWWLPSESWSYVYSSGDRVSVEPFCPKVCRTIPYPDDISTCREYAYNCRLFLDKGQDKARGCFKNLSLSGADYVDPDTNTQKTVPTITVSGGKLKTIQKDPVIAATDYSCGVLQPLAIPPNIPLKDKEGNSYDDVAKNNLLDKFCPNAYRYMTFDFTSLPDVEVDVPYEGVGDPLESSCNEFFSEAGALDEQANLVRDAAALFNPGKRVCLVLDVTNLEETMILSTPGINIDGTTTINKRYLIRTLLSCERRNDGDLVLINAFPSYTGSNVDAGICYGKKTTRLTDEASCKPTKCGCFVDNGDGTVSLSEARCDKKSCNNGETKVVLECTATVHRYNLQTKLQVQPSTTNTITEDEVRSLMEGNLPFQQVFTRYLESDNLQGDYEIEGSCKTFNPSPTSPQREEDIVDESQRIVNNYGLALPIFVRGNCGNIAAVPSEALKLPPTVDCSKCTKFGRSPLAANLKSSVQGMEFLANAYIRIMLIPTIALALTGAILVALSSYLGGEMFIPAIEKVL